MAALKPLPQSEVVRLFGDPSPFILPDGGISALWERHVTAGRVALLRPLPLAWDHARTVSGFRCHPRVAGAFQSALDAIFNLPEAWDTINDFGGCYNWRPQRKSRVLSRHCWGIAVDLDVGDNPFGREPKVHPDVQRIFAEHGFAWGGNFTGLRRDGMHFEPADAARFE